MAYLFSVFFSALSVIIINCSVMLALPACPELALRLGRPRGRADAAAVAEHTLILVAYVSFCWYLIIIITMFFSLKGKASFLFTFIIYVCIC